MTHLWQNPKLRVDMRVKCSMFLFCHPNQTQYVTKSKINKHKFVWVFISKASKLFWGVFFHLFLEINRLDWLCEILTFNESMKYKIWFTSCEYDMHVDIFRWWCCCSCRCCCYFILQSFYLGAQFVSFYFVRHFTVALFLRVRVCFSASVTDCSFVFLLIKFVRYFFFLFICLIHKIFLQSTTKSRSTCMVWSFFSFLFLFLAI